MKAKVSRGSGFRGVLNYALSPDKGASVVAGTMSSRDPRSLASEFAISREQRPEVERPVWQCSLSLPPGEQVDDVRWAAVVSDFIQTMGLDGNQWLAIRHDDTPHNHVHIIASRISLDGQVWHGQWEARRAIQATQDLERRYGLQVTPGLDSVESEKHKRNPTKNEIERAGRTGEAAARQVLQQLVDESVSDGLHVETMLDRLEAAGVKVVPNVAKTGRLNGFKFGYKGVWFTGQQLGKSYTWSQLSKRGVQYEQESDGQRLVERAERIRSTVDQDARGSGTGDIRSSRHADRELVHDRRGEPAPDREHGGSGEVDRRESKTSDPGLQARTVEKQVRDRPGDRQNPGGRKADKASDGVRNIQRRSDRWRESAARSADLAAAGVRSDTKGFAGPGSGLSKAAQAKLKAWRSQHDALQAPAYRITLTSRVEGKPSFNAGKGKGPDGSERHYNSQDVEQLIPWLSRQNALGYDVYITPIDPRYHYIVVDDMSEDDHARLKQDGWNPALVQESSENNRQAIIKVPKPQDSEKAEQSRANKLVQELNKQFGDSEFSGVIHPFRAAGFSNKKPGKGSPFTRLVEATRKVCQQATDWLSAIRKSDEEEEQRKAQERAVEREKTSRTRAVELPERGPSSGLKAEYQREARRVLGLVRAKGWPEDWSRIDWQATRNLLMSGADPEAVKSVLVDSSPQLADRHNQPDDYASRTVDNAMTDIEVIEARAQRARQQQQGDEEDVDNDMRPR